MDKSIEFLKSTITNTDDYIIVGCSAGPDSMCLLDILYKTNFKIVCAHVNHNIRKESTREEEFLEEYCKKRKIEFVLLRLDKKKKQNESYYRQKRYEFYKSTADKYKTRFITTAHHGDDLIETVLMRISRGSNLKGYVGFSKIWQEEKYTFLKPLIYYSKEDILKYDEENGIPYFIDKTNEEDDYTRNRFRHYVLPFLKKEEPKVASKFLSYSEELNSACMYINTEVQKAYKDNFKNSELDLDSFLKIDKFLQRKELDLILSYIYRDDINLINSTHTKKLLELLSKEKNFKYNLPKNILATREYQKLYFKNSIQEKNNYRYVISSTVTLDDKSTIEIIDESDDESNFTIRLNSKDILLPIYVRNRQSGDTMEVKGLKGNQKVKKIMIDKKVPPSLRNTYPVVTDSNDSILWLPGLKKSKFDNEKNEKYDIILKYTKKKGINE